MTLPGRICVVCGSDHWVDLPEVGPQSMASDWRVLPVPLQQARLRRLRIGLERDASACRLLRTRLLALRSRALCLAAGAPKAATVRALDRCRLPSAPHNYRSHDLVLDVGCGNGSLLLALGDEWPSATLAGCDPSAEAVAHANAAGCRVWQGTCVEPAGRSPGRISSSA